MIFSDLHNFLKGRLISGHEYLKVVLRSEVRALEGHENIKLVTHKTKYS